METQKQGEISGKNHYTADEILATDSLAADWTEQEVMAFITDCFDRDILLKALLGYASNWLSTRLVTVITKAGLQPFLLEGVPGALNSENDLQHLRTLRAPYQPVDENIDGQAGTDENLLTILPADSTGLEPLFNLLALPTPDRLAIQPVQVATKTVLLLIGEPQNPAVGDTPPERDIFSLNAVATAVGNQLGEIIGRAKSATLPPVDERIPHLPHPLHVLRASALIVEELTDALITQSEAPSTLIDDGWLDLLEGPKPAEPEQSALEEVISPTPILHNQPDHAESPTHTLELFPDALLDLSTTGKTITHGFETLSDDTSDPDFRSELAQQNEQVHSTSDKPRAEQSPFHENNEPEHPIRTLELFIIDGNLADPDDPAEKNLTGKTLSGGFEAIKRDSQPTPQPTPQPAIPNAGVLRRMSLTPKTFDALNKPANDTIQTESQSHQPVAPESSTPKFDPEPYQKTFPGQLLVDRYQHTPQTMPPAHEHGPLLAELTEAGPPALEVVQAFINSTSIELRFYAVLLLAEMPVHNMLDAVVERLFDRDQQIRALAKKIVLDARLNTNFERIVVQRMRHEIITNIEDIRVEVAAEIIGAIQDSHAIPLLIEALGEHRTRIQLVLQDALTRLTFQDLAPSISEWRRWWQTAQHQPRTTWLIDALNSPNEEIRQAAFNHIQQIPGLNLNYHPSQPQKLRARAQQELTQWFENF